MKRRLETDLIEKYMDRPTNFKSVSQRVLKGPRGITMFLGILTEQSLAPTDMPWEVF